ncbi:Telomerase Protein Component 1 [Manis pentadactyla]|nr:Telomerase Protein Component 1 [Manis pentadactyla]
MFQGPAGPPPPPPASLPDHPQIHVHWAGTRSVGVSSVPECLENPELPAATVPRL